MTRTYVCPLCGEQTYKPNEALSDEVLPMRHTRTDDCLRILHARITALEEKNGSNA